MEKGTKEVRFFSTDIGGRDEKIREQVTLKGGG